MLSEMATWINGTLIGPDGYLAPTVFESSIVLYQTKLYGSFLLSVIDGSSRPARFSKARNCSAYNELIRVIRRVSVDEPAFWFYGTDPDNDRSMLSRVRLCQYGGSMDSYLELFETEPATEGGSAWLGLAAVSRQWLLLHEYIPCESFAITIYGTAEFCRAVSAGVGAEPEPNNVVST